MSLDSSSHSGSQPVVQQRFLSLFLRSKREAFRNMAAWVPNIADAEDFGSYPSRFDATVLGPASARN
ncbi:MAG TPA: hypothetical protein VMF06_10955 [Candidatus Limnocylindria bacterium]|jgi:hypothetical protein|nr:hypothetical protein [Candidatus Limnocylindria bacterium]